MSFLQNRLRWMGIFGILGGLLLFAGDMLFYYNAESTDLKMNMAQASGLRIKLSAVTALLATWFYVIGAGQVFYAFKPASKWVQQTVFVSFTGIMIVYGIVHAAYVAIAATAKLALQYGLDIDAAVRLSSGANDLLRLFAYPLFGVLSVLFIGTVWKGKTLYPKWIILFFPLIPFLFQGVIHSVLTGKLWTIIAGGFLNIILIVFFTASTVALWNKRA